MAKIRIENPETQQVGHGRHQIYCPACYEQAKKDDPESPGYWMHRACHTISFPGWTFNGDYESPTIQPSIKFEHPSYGIVCHSYVTSGKIQYLTDCTHGFGGQTLDLLDVPTKE